MKLLEGCRPELGVQVGRTDWLALESTIEYLRERSIVFQEALVGISSCIDVLQILANFWKRTQLRHKQRR